MQGKVVKMWREMEQLLFKMSKLDKGAHTMQDFWEMDVYSLFRYKQLLIEDLKNKNGREPDE